MLTLFKELFIWWNRQTLGTRIHTIMFGKLVGKDKIGNKYFKDKNGKRWVIYSKGTEATNIPLEWYSWMHYTNNKLEKNRDFKKYHWQKDHKPNLTGTDKAYNPNKNKNASKKKYTSWKN